MAVEVIGGGTSASQQVNLQTLGVTQEDFFKILITQLQFQDPLKPIDNQAFIAQIAQFTSLEQSRQTNNRIDDLLTIQATTQSIGLIGKTVEIDTAAGPAVGAVSTLTFENGQPLLTVTTATGQVLTGIGPSRVRVIR
jgi:flagellar basal-body rod modification protein FlgD